MAAKLWKHFLFSARFSEEFSCITPHLHSVLVYTKITMVTSDWSASAIIHMGADQAEKSWLQIRPCIYVPSVFVWWCRATYTAAYIYRYTDLPQNWNVPWMRDLNWDLGNLEAGQVFAVLKDTLPCCGTTANQKVPFLLGWLADVKWKTHFFASHCNKMIGVIQFTRYSFKPCNWLVSLSWKSISGCIEECTDSWQSSVYRLLFTRMALSSWIFVFPPMIPSLPSHSSHLLVRFAFPV